MWQQVGKAICSVTMWMSVVATVSEAANSAQAATKGTVEVVDAYSTDVYSLKIAAGQTIEVEIDGDNSTDLDLYLIDPKGRIIASDDDELDLCLLCKYVCTSGGHKLKVVNRGCKPNLYRIVVEQSRLASN